MKVAFLCGALEPGRDGVGDYTRKLAGQLLVEGHKAIIISLNDKCLAGQVDGIQQDNELAVPVLRLPAIISEEERFREAKKYLNSFRPDYISLQFVPYSFNIKGLPFGFFKKLKGIYPNAKWHIMFHEIWLDKPDRVTQYLVMLLQKYIILTGVIKVKPEAVSVTISHNQKRLKSIGVEAQILSLFGNISKSKSNILPKCFQSEATLYSQRVLYFGRAPRGAFLEQIVIGLVDYCKGSSKHVELILIGGSSTEKDNFIETLESRLNKHKLTIADCGFLNTDELSTVICNCTVGIVRSDPYLIGKSGAAVAMLEHGLPIWLPKWDGIEKMDYSFRNEIIFSTLQEASIQTSQLEYKSLLPKVAADFIEQLNNS